ncbi:MAG: hypothetical protein IKZ55_10130 [Bacteroidales bacterium]|nr:hypothetical protein [Bacteroidales bacterium]
MNIELHKITVRELTKGYADNNENGVRAYGGRLDVRPPYQREFVYGEKERDAVIDTLTNGFPLNVMYWARRRVTKKSGCPLFFFEREVVTRKGSPLLVYKKSGLFC